MVYRLASMRHDYEGTFATKEVDQKLKKRINGKGLMNRFRETNCTLGILGASLHKCRVKGPSRKLHPET